MELACKLTTSVRDEAEGLETQVLYRYHAFNSIFSEIDGNQASQTDRSRNSLSDEQGLTYGEITYLGFLEMLKAAGAADGQIFYDLGCGSGKALVAAALSDVRFLRCVGVELLPTVCACAREAVELLKSSLTDKALCMRMQITLPMLEVREGDITACDWSEADLVYLSSVCFPDAVMQSLLHRGRELKAGARILTLRMLPEGYQQVFALEPSVWARMSWGKMEVFVLRRLAVGER